MPEAILLTCKTCGYDFVLPEGMLLSSCPACGTRHSRPRATQSALADLRRAHQQRCSCDFINAEANYQRVLNAHPDEAEALWGLALCKYGVEYVQDDKTSQYLPTIHFLNRKPFTEDPDCRLAIARADEGIRPRYQQDAEYITRIQQEVLAAEARGTDCDVFLCYKQSVPGSADPDARTREFFHAQELYVALRDAGFRVFFAHTTLRRAAGANYEAQIFHALQSARVMLVITSNPAHLMTPWVHSEWTRYLERVDAREDCRLIPLLYDRCEPYALPDAFLRRSIQGLRMDSVTALDDLRRILQECLPSQEPAVEEKPAVVQQTASPATEPLLRRAFLFLEDSDWHSADEYCERVLDADPENARAYVGKLMAALKVRKQEKLRDQAQPFDNDPNYRKALRFADEGLAKELRGMIAHIKERNENAAKEAAYKKAEQALAAAKAEQDFIAAQNQFEALGGWKDAAKRAQECASKAENARKEGIYFAALQYMRNDANPSDLHEAIRLFQSIPGCKDADQQIAVCQQRIYNISVTEAAREERKRREEALIAAKNKAAQRRKRRIGFGTAVLAAIIALVLLTQVIIPNGKYNAAVQLMNDGDYPAAIAAFEALDGYRDSEKYIKYSAASSLEADGAKDLAAMRFYELGDFQDARTRSMALWNDIAVRAPIAAGYWHTVGLRADGSVVAVGYNEYVQCDVSEWQDIVAIAAGGFHTVGLRADGSVVAVDSNSSGICDVSEWQDIVAISAGTFHTVGLRADGSVVAVGDNSSGNCDFSEWQDIVAIAAGDCHTVGLRADGSVVAVGDNKYGQCDVSEWQDIVAIAASGRHTVGLRADGSVIAVGDNSKGQCDISEWQNIVAIAAGGDHTVGLRADGSVVAVGFNTDGQCDVSDWQLKQVPRPTLPE